MKYGSNYSIGSGTLKGINTVQLATVDHKTVAIMSGTFNSEELRKLADCLDGKKNIVNEFEINHIQPANG